MNGAVMIGRYQMRSMRKGAVVFGIVMLAVVLVSVFVALLAKVEGITFMSVEISAAITVGVCGLNAFKESFEFGLQNGVTRKHLYVGTILSGAGLALLYAVMEEALVLITFIAERVADNLVWLSLTDGLLYPLHFQEISGVLGRIENVAFNFAVNLALFMIGYFVTAAYYHMSKLVKLVVSIGVPVFFIIVFPVLDLLLLDGRFYAELAELFARCFGLVSGNPWCAVATCTVTAGVMTALTWPLIRRAVIKE